MPNIWQINQIHWIKETSFFLAVVNVDSSHTEYTLSSLSSDTLYMVRMAAYTDEGGKDGPEFTFTTPKFGKKSWSFIYLKLD